LIRSNQLLAEPTSENELTLLSISWLKALEKQPVHRAWIIYNYVEKQTTENAHTAAIYAAAHSLWSLFKSFFISSVTLYF
jgi:hypothetical protein